MKIGRIVKVLEDQNRKETLVEGHAYRKIIMSIFYPTLDTFKETKQATYVDLYHPHEEAFINQYKDYVLIKDDKEKEHYLKQLKSNIYDHAPMNITNPLPVIIELTGLGAPRDFMTYTFEDLIKEGYIVITLGHFYDSMLSVKTDGTLVDSPKKLLSQEDKKEILDIRKNDLLFLLDELETLNQSDPIFKDTFDLTKIGVIGHSLGGAAAFKATQCDSRIKATILYDASLHFFHLSPYLKENKSLTTPVLNFRRDFYDYKSSMKEFIDQLRKQNREAESFKEGILIYDEVLRDLEQEQKNLYHYLTGYRSFIKLSGSNHMTFTDYPILINQDINQLHQTINYLTMTFMNEFLCGKQGEYTNHFTESPFITEIKKEDI